MNKKSLAKTDKGQESTLKFEPDKGSKLKLDANKKDECKKIFIKALATGDHDLQMRVLNDIAFTYKGVQSSEGLASNKLLADACTEIIEALYEAEPQNAFERMLLSQMIGVHQVAMRALQNAMLKDQWGEAIDININRANKLLRTFTAQMEALRRHRTGGQQKVLVEHVTVNDGGQAAFVGEVGSREGGKNEK